MKKLTESHRDNLEMWARETQKDINARMEALCAVEGADGLIADLERAADALREFSGDLVDA